MSRTVRESPTSKASLINNSTDVAATDTTRIELSRKQAVDMEMFWNNYVKADRRLLFIICSDFRQYTVETLLWVSFDSSDSLQKEIAWDSHFSRFQGFDAWGVLHESRIDARDALNWPKPTWPKGVGECLDCVVPAARVAEVAAWFAPFTELDLFAMDDTVIL